MKTTLKLKRSTKAKLRNVFIILISVIGAQYSDYIQRLPYFIEGFFLLTIFVIIKSYRREAKKKALIESRKSKYLKSHYDDFGWYFILLIILPVSLYLSFHSWVEATWMEIITYSLFGLWFLWELFTNRETVELITINENTIQAVDSDFDILSTDKALNFTMFHITRTESDGETSQLKNLKLDYEGAVDMVNWLRAKWPTSTMKYYWEEEEKVMEIK